MINPEDYPLVKAIIILALSLMGLFWHQRVVFLEATFLSIPSNPLPAFIIWSLFSPNNKGLGLETLEGLYDY